MIRNFCTLCWILLVLSACQEQESRKQSVMMVKAQTVKNYQNELQTTYPGRIRAASDVDLSFRIAGPILRIPVEEGQFVRKGQVIAEIDPRDYRLQFEATEAQYRQVKAEAERVIELYRRKSVPANDYDKAVSGLQQISSKYAAHRNALEDTQLKAPFDGYIQKKYFETSETVGAGMPVISMIETRYFEVEIDIPSSIFIRQKYFKNFSCVADVFPDHVFPLSLLDITKKANLNQLYRLRLKLDKTEGLPVAAGMSVNVIADFFPGDVIFTEIPLNALSEKGEKSTVWIYDPTDRSVHNRPVTISQILKDGRVILSEGLKAGEMVITAGTHKLKEGMKVELLKPVSPTNKGGLL